MVSPVAAAPPPTDTNALDSPLTLMFALFLQAAAAPAVDEADVDEAGTERRRRMLRIAAEGPILAPSEQPEQVPYGPDMLTSVFFF